MKKIAAEPYRDIEFSKATQGAVIQPAVGKTKISIRLDNHVIEYFRGLVDANGEGNYQTLINDALVTYIQQRSLLEVVRQVIREEITPTKTKLRTVRGSTVHA